MRSLLISSITRNSNRWGLSESGWFQLTSHLSDLEEWEYTHSMWSHCSWWLEITPKQITKDVILLVVDCSFAYNAILGHLTLNSWKTVTSTYHLMIKFPTEYGVGEVWGDQVAVHECYIAMLEMFTHQIGRNVQVYVNDMLVKGQ